MTGLMKNLPDFLIFLCGLCKYFFGLKKPHDFRDKLSPKSRLKMRIWYACLAYFNKKLQAFISFSLTPKQQKEIVFHVTRIAILVENEFDSDSSVLTSGNFRNVVMENVANGNDALLKISQQISSSMLRMRELVHDKQNYDNFRENIIKTWETHKIRDVKECNNSLSKSDAAQCSEDRGGFYFLALAFALNPANLTKAYQSAIYFCGAWFQITDDYKDRKKDKGVRNTPFTIGDDATPKKILDAHKTAYKSKIKSFAPDQNALVEFMEKLCALISSILNPF